MTIPRNIATTKTMSWRFLLGRIPLPMLALAASHGVYSFGTLYMPWYFALISALAFEATYVGLAVAELHSSEERGRARNISIGAVVVSILYNAVAAYFHRNPEALVNMAWYAEAGLALLHAAPLATVAYLVASLLLHSETMPIVNIQTTVKTLTTRPVSMRRAMMAPKQAHFPAPHRVNIGPLTTIDTKSDDPRAADVRRLRDIDKLTYKEIALHIGLSSRQSAQNLYKHGRTYAPRKDAQ